MRILVAPDKFKGSLGAAEVGFHLAAGFRAVWPEAEIQIVPIADGGEGTAEVIRAARGGINIECATHDARGREIRARYTWIDSDRLAIIDVSAAVGLARLAPDERDPSTASTFGVGEMLQAACARGADRILIGLGGSATNDGGTDLAQALGFRFLDSAGQEISTFTELETLARLERPNELALPPITALADVRNPLLGPEGATRTFGPQKGANPLMIETLERALSRLAKVAAQSGSDFSETPGAGAAGGLGFGLLVFFGAELRSGFEVVAETICLRRALQSADFVVTGEGSLDRQTLSGKAPAGVARLARELGKPVYAIAGRASDDAELRALFDQILTLDERPPFARTAELLEDRARTLAESWRA